MDDVLKDTWAIYKSWAATSRRKKKQVTTLTRVVLALTLIGTAVGSLAQFAPRDMLFRDLLPWLAAATLGVATFLTSQLLSPEQIWVKARAVAEALKSECYKYVTKTSPYDVADAGTVLRRQSNDLTQTMAAQIRDQIPAGEAAKGLPEQAWTLDDYVKGRVDDQITFLEDGVRKASRAIKRARTLAITLGLLAVVLSVSGRSSASTTAQQTGGAPAPQAGTLVAAFLGVVTTAAAAIAAAFQSGRHQQIALNYQTAWDQLRQLKARRDKYTDHTQFVSDAETIMRAEHAAWLTASIPTPAKTG